MRRVWRLALVSAVALGTMIVGEGRAWAACHAFSVAISPSTVAEGSAVTVTVSRDGAVAPSNVDVSTIDETAVAGSDYQAVHRTVSFTTDVQQSFTVPVTNDAATEPSETFRVHLSNPGGCSINPNFSVGSDKRVTITASDAAPPTTAPPTTAPPTTAPPTTQPGPGTTTPRATTTTTSDGLSTTSTAPGSTTTEPSSSTTVRGSTTTADDTSDTTAIDGEAVGSAAEDDDDGSGGIGAPAAIVGVLALGGLGYLIYRRRATPTS